MNKEEIFSKYEKLDYELSTKTYLTGSYLNLKVKHEYIVTWHLNNRSTISHEITKEEYETLLKSLEDNRT